MIEPVLGSGGCVAPPDSFWPALVELCARARLAAVRRRGQDRDRALGRAVRGRALGGRARPDVPRQGARRRRDADRRAARLRARARRLRRRPHRQHLGLAARLVRRGARDARRSSSASRCSRTCASWSASARRASAELRDRFEEIGDVRAVGCFMAIEFVADRETQGARPRASGRGRRPRPAAAGCWPTPAPRRSTSSPRW